MSTAQRPRLASWLLRRFVAGPQRESLIGDLDERFVSGRSSLWYWRQVVSAILVGVVRDLRQQQRLAIGSVMLTWAIVIVWVESTLALYLWEPGSVKDHFDRKLPVSVPSCNRAPNALALDGEHELHVMRCRR